MSRELNVGFMSLDRERKGLECELGEIRGHEKEILTKQSIVIMMQ